MRLSVALASAALIVACTADAPTALSSSSLAGTWWMRKFGGSSLPAVITSGVVITEWMGDLYTLNADGSYEEVGSQRLRSDVIFVSVVSRREAGTWRLADSTVTFSPSSLGGVPKLGTPYTGVATSTTITIGAGLYRR
jgi:hypothetical protein